MADLQFYAALDDRRFDRSLSRMEQRTARAGARIGRGGLGAFLTGGKGVGGAAKIGLKGLGVGGLGAFGGAGAAGAVAAIVAGAIAAQKAYAKLDAQAAETNRRLADGFTKAATSAGRFTNLLTTGLANFYGGGGGWASRQIDAITDFFGGAGTSAAMQQSEALTRGRSQADAARLETLPRQSELDRLFGRDRDADIADAEAQYQRAVMDATEKLKQKTIDSGGYNAIVDLEKQIRDKKIKDAGYTGKFFGAGGNAGSSAVLAAALGTGDGTPRDPRGEQRAREQTRIAKEQAKTLKAIEKNTSTRGPARFG